MRTLAVPHLQSALSLWYLHTASELQQNGDTGDTTASRQPSNRYGVVDPIVADLQAERVFHSAAKPLAENQKDRRWVAGFDARHTNTDTAHLLV